MTYTFLSLRDVIRNGTSSGRCGLIPSTQPEKYLKITYVNKTNIKKYNNLKISLLSVKYSFSPR